MVSAQACVLLSAADHRAVVGVVSSLMELASVSQRIQCLQEQNGVRSGGKGAVQGHEETLF